MLRRYYFALGDLIYNITMSSPVYSSGPNTVSSNINLSHPIGTGLTINFRIDYMDGSFVVHSVTGSVFIPAGSTSAVASGTPSSTYAVGSRYGTTSVSPSIYNAIRIISKNPY